MVLQSSLRCKLFPLYQILKAVCFSEHYQIICLTIFSTSFIRSIVSTFEIDRFNHFSLIPYHRDLSSGGLSGPSPPSIQKLMHLRKLYVQAFVINTNSFSFKINLQSGIVLLSNQVICQDRNISINGSSGTNSLFTSYFTYSTR